MKFIVLVTAAFLLVDSRIQSRNICLSSLVYVS